MQFLQKIEKIFESSPQYLIQSYVLLRSDASSNDGTTLAIQLISLFLSLYAIADKLISDDKKMFIEKSGANKAFIPRPKYIYRVLFRICEVIANLGLLLVLSVYFGSLVCALYIGWQLLINVILFRNGLLEQDKSNIIAYLVAIMNLGVTSNHSTCLDNHYRSNNDNDKSCISNIVSKISQKIVSMTYLSCFFAGGHNNNWKIAKIRKDNNNDKHRGTGQENEGNHGACVCTGSLHGESSRFLSYYYIITRITQGIFIVVISIVIFYATKDSNWDSVLLPSAQARYAHSLELQLFLFATLFCYIMQYVFYRKMFDALHLGMLLRFVTFVC